MNYIYTTVLAIVTHILHKYGLLQNSLYHILSIFGRLQTCNKIKVISFLIKLLFSPFIVWHGEAYVPDQDNAETAGTDPD